MILDLVSTLSSGLFARCFADMYLLYVLPFAERSTAVKVLKPLSKHKSAFVREGVVPALASVLPTDEALRLLSGTLLKRLADEVGEGTVTKVVVRGPTGPSWRRGPRVAPGGQGPRDTYG